MEGYVRNLSIELVKRLLYDRHWVIHYLFDESCSFHLTRCFFQNRRQAKVLLVIVTCKSEEVRFIHSLEKYECEPIITKVRESIFDNPKLKDESGAW